MLIEIAQIPPDGLDLALPAEPLELGESAGVWDGPAVVRAELHVGRSGRGVMIGGDFSGTITLICSRCLEPFSHQAGDRFDVYCEPSVSTLPGEEHNLGGDDLDVTYLEEGRIDTDHLLRENLLLTLPVQPLCRADCRGLCPQCGVNWNLGTCQCEARPSDPRLGVLRKLL
jgi:uncharacterized protein